MRALSQYEAKLEEGERGFDILLLREWFGWATLEMAGYYAGRRGEKDIMKQFGVKPIKYG